ncbi:prepilin peptidase [Actinoplanes sp. NBRC 101535]|uniref:prepilin peptidase n=1 Tax=Actinoplanes sp. NBRC 101535 TaxID=3032196 RepID=UPI0024A087D0|nr:prepilin peptidase [Actinoplanes sp. NBRC 101535]GLY08521.1 hypothetical protein Acsp01_89000 [Actinoplanes sp. NBRC 101535]
MSPLAVVHHLRSLFSGCAVRWSALCGLVGAILADRPVYLIGAFLGVVLAAIDLRCRRLPDPLVAGLAVTTAVPLAVTHPDRIGTALAAGALTGAGYLAIALLPGQGLGLGDVKLGAVLALILGFSGWPAVATGLGAAHVLGGLTAAWLLLTGRSRTLAFGPALLTGGLIGVTTA